MGCFSLVKPNFFCRCAKISHAQKILNGGARKKKARKKTHAKISSEAEQSKVKADILKYYMHTIYILRYESFLNFFQVDLDDQINFVYVDTRGNEEIAQGSGVTRDVYTTFWEELADSYLIGEQQRVPFVRHDMFENEWESIGKIIVKSYLDVGYFPTILSEAFVLYCLFGNVSRDTMISSFLVYVAPDERDIIKKAILPEVAQEFLDSDEVLDLLDQFKCRSRVLTSNISEIVYEIARQELLQKPHLMATCWKNSFTRLKVCVSFSCCENVLMLYNKSQPTTKKVIDLLRAEPKNDQERESYGYLKKYIRG